MSNVAKSVQVFSSVLRLLLGSNVSTAIERTLEDHPQTRYVA